MSSKRGQIHSEFIRIFIIATIIVLISYFGYKGFSKISETTCKSELALFEKDLQVAAREMSSQTGSVEERKYKVPCNVERMYFFDLNAFATLDKGVPFEPFENYPEINDSIQSGVEKNVFLVKGNKIRGSFYMGDIKIGVPYYDCYITKYGTLDIYLEGIKGKAGIAKKDDKFDCTFIGDIPVVLSDEDSEDMFKYIGEEFEEDRLGWEECEIERTITVEGEETIITITNCDVPNTFFEEIPKCALEVLADLGEISFTGDGEILEEDPIIMWDFEVGGEISYILEAIKENCKREFRGVPVEKFESEPELDYIQDGLRDISPQFGGQFNFVEHWISKGDTEKARERIEDLLEDLDKLFGEEEDLEERTKIENMISDLGDLASGE